RPGEELIPVRGQRLSEVLLGARQHRRREYGARVVREMLAPFLAAQPWATAFWRGLELAGEGRLDEAQASSAAAWNQALAAPDLGGVYAGMAFLDVSVMAEAGHDRIVDLLI